jgi:hypothetical protein
MLSWTHFCGVNFKNGVCHATFHIRRIQSPKDNTNANNLVTIDMQGPVQNAVLGFQVHKILP